MHNNCDVCRGIHNNEALARPLSNVALAAQLGVNEASIRRHRKAGLNDVAEVDSFFGVPTSAITSRGRSIRLEDGSWEKVSYNPATVALAEARRYEDIVINLDDFDPDELPEPTGGTLHVVLADWQVGKTDENGGADAFIARINRSMRQVLALIERLNPSEVILWELGDIIENFNNTPQQRETNDLDLVTQIRVARRVLKDIVVAVATRVPSVTVVSVPSNHGQVRVGMGNKNGASTPSNDFGVEINHMVEDIFAERPEFRHVRFVTPPGKFEDAVTVTTLGGTVVGAVHGHQANSPGKMGDYWKGMSHGRRANLHNADILLFGHHHHFTLTQSGDERWLIGAPALDGGSAWYSNRTGESSKSGILVFTTEGKDWNELHIC